MRLPLTARQAQRLLFGKKGYDGDHLVEVAKALGLYDSGYSCWAFYKPVKAELSRIAQVSGPNTVILASPDAESSNREHKIGTNEVSPQSESPSDESDTHGGDSTSGEVEDGLSQGGDNESGAGGDAGNSEQGSDVADTPLSVSPQSRDPKAGRAASPGDGETTSGDNGGSAGNQPGGGNGSPDDNRDTDGQLRPESETAMSDKPLAKTAGGAGHKVQRSEAETGEAKTDAEQNLVESDSETDSLTGRANPNGKTGDERPDAQAKQSGKANGDTALEKYRYRSIKSGSGRQPSTAAKESHGGITAEMSRAGVTSSLVKKTRAALARLIDGGESQTGPRWDWVEFSTRLKTHRPLQPARREEEGRPAILVLADVSGSCAGFSDISLTVAQAVARLGVAGADVIVVSHSNGYPHQWMVNNGQVQEVDLGWGADALPWYEKNLRRFNIEGAIALGDWDAEWLYHWLAEMPAVRRFVWLDNWSCNNLPTPVVRRDLFQKAAKNNAADWNTPWQFSQPWSVVARRKSTYVVGCADANDFIVGIKLALRSK